jgi:sensor domain CHASE-containing protein
MTPNERHFIKNQVVKIKIIQQLLNEDDEKNRELIHEQLNIIKKDLEELTRD